jgi:septal ring factor EnvC (AmiA/AmiB activator)
VTSGAPFVTFPGTLATHRERRDPTGSSRGGRRLAAARLTVILAVAVSLIAPATSSAQEPDPEETQRQLDEVRSQRGEADVQVDVLVAKEAEVQAALVTLEANVATQQAELDEAERALTDAEAELAAATEAVAAEEATIDELDDETDALVVEAFVNPPSDNALDAFRADSLSDATVKQALVGIRSDADADALDQLEQAHEDLEVAEADKAELAAAAAAQRATAETELTEVENALAQQEAFAADVEEQLNAKLAEAESLRQFDAALADQLVREQAEVAAQLRAAQEAAAARAAADAEAARAAAAANSAPAPAPAPSGGGGGGGGGGPARSAIQPAPGGLATVTCPYGGSISVAGSIAGNVQGLLDAAAAQGVSLCASSGWRSPQRQVELRRQNCGSSTYAIYQMPSSRCSPPTAIPGSSLHERGLAIDFSCNGGGAVRRGNSCWNFLAANAGSYGLYNLPSEPWHWSTTGG